MRHEIGKPKHLFASDYKYWFMAPFDEMDLDTKEENYVLNRAKLYCGRRDFDIQKGDSGRRGDYPDSPITLS